MKRICAFLLTIVLLLPIPACKQEQEQLPEASEQIITVDITPEMTATPEPTPTPVPTESPTPVPPTPEPTATPEPTPTPQPYVALDGIYTIAWLSDPQHYAKKYPETYYTMTAFLRDHREEMNLQYIAFTGDMIHNIQISEQWEVAKKAMSYIDDIPHGVLAGNHDVAGDYGFSKFQQYFGESKFKDKPWYGGSYHNNRGHYDLFTAGGTDYIFVYMGYGPSKECFQWVRKMFRKYPDRVGVLCLHDYYTNDQTLSTDGQKWHDRVVSTTPNLYMVLCGHRYGAYCFPETFDDDGDGRDDWTVYQMLFNYQALDDGGGGFMRLIQIDEANGTMHHLTYSPLWDSYNRFADPEQRTLSKYYTFDETHEEFTLPLPWRITHD